MSKIKKKWPTNDKNGKYDTVKNWLKIRHTNWMHGYLMAKEPAACLYCVTRITIRYTNRWHRYKIQKTNKQYTRLTTTKF